jgi:hypothetical protein
VSQLLICHSVQAERDTESSNFELVPVLRRDDVWMPVFTGMTTLIALFAIAAQSQWKKEEKL